MVIAHKSYSAAILVHSYERVHYVTLLLVHTDKHDKRALKPMGKSKKDTNSQPGTTYSIEKHICGAPAITHRPVIEVRDLCPGVSDDP